MLFYKCLKVAQMNNEISKNKNCREIANYLSCFTFGLVNAGMKIMKKNEVIKMINLVILSVKN